MLVILFGFLIYFLIAGMGNQDDLNGDGFNSSSSSSSYGEEGSSSSSSSFEDIKASLTKTVKGLG
ncbi:hypothetical protein C4572_01405 [Candidatus Parcubacteria bacterium]|nr:MAG: hypothetical protein C4572_01405 [Candidatus Parcubacteria bacterium]